MDIINESLRSNLKILNENLKEKLNEIQGLDRESIRKNLEEFGILVNLEKLDGTELRKFSPMACVDGSVNRYGGSHPHYIDIFQGLSKLSGVKSKSIFKSNVFSPIFDSHGEEEEEEIRNKLLASIEVEVAIETLLSEDLKTLLMDGNLLRYSIRSSENYEELKEMCEYKNIILAGFIKEAKSDFLFELMFPHISEFTLYDKDLLYGVLNIGEAFIFHDEYNKKLEKDISSMLLRTSNYPGIGGIEILNSQKEYMLDIGNLCYSLTSSASRGVPMIIDIVDKEVKLDDKLTTELINSYIEKEVIERFFVSERSLRRY